MRDRCPTQARSSTSRSCVPPSSALIRARRRHHLWALSSVYMFGESLKHADQDTL